MSETVAVTGDSSSVLTQLAAGTLVPAVGACFGVIFGRKRLLAIAAELMVLGGVKHGDHRRGRSGLRVARGAFARRAGSGAIAVTNAANAIRSKVAGSPSLKTGGDGFNSSSKVPEPLKPAVHSGPLGREREQG